MLEGRLAAKGSGLGLAPTIPVGMRAVTVRVNDVAGVAGFVLPGMRVDVLVTGQPPTADGDMTTTVLQNMLVLSAGTTMQADARGQAIQAPTVTLLATPRAGRDADAGRQRRPHPTGAAQFERSERRKDHRAATSPSCTARRARRRRARVGARPRRLRGRCVIAAAPPPRASAASAAGPDRGDPREHRRRWKSCPSEWRIKGGNEHESQSRNLNIQRP